MSHRELQKPLVWMMVSLILSAGAATAQDYSNHDEAIGIY